MPLTLNNAPIPVSDQFVRMPATPRGQREDRNAGLLTDVAIEWLNALGTTVSSSATRVNAVNLTGQSAAIGATDMSGGGVNSGLYRVSYYMRVTTPASVSSSLTVTLAWTDGGVPQAITFAAATGNTTSTTQSGTQLIRVDSVTPITYAVAYASVGTAAVYSFDVVLEQVQA